MLSCFYFLLLGKEENTVPCEPRAGSGGLVLTMCSLPRRARAVLAPTEGCTPKQHQSRFLTGAHPTFKLEPGTLTLCNSLSTLTLPTPGPL